MQQTTARKSLGDETIMAETQRDVVVGAFEDRRDAERTVKDLHRAGFGDEQIGFAARDGEAARGSTAGEGAGHAGSGAAGGVVTGGIVGGILGALAAGLIPGIGPVIAGGILAGVLGGAAVGAAAGGLLGALMGMGVPEEEAHHYNREFESGRTIVTVRADGRADEARAIMQRHGMLRYGGQTMAEAGEVRRETRDRGTMELREEQLEPRRESAEVGRVGVGKEIVEEERTIDVPITREEVTVERRPVEARPSDQPVGRDETIEVPIREEQVEVEKQPVVYQEVEIGKRQVQGTERVTETVRREELRTEGDVDVRGGRTAARGMTGTAGMGAADSGQVGVPEGSGAVRGWNEAGPLDRQMWERRNAGTGRWEDVEPYRRYGYEMAQDPRYRDREWSEIEPSLRSDYSAWARQNQYTPDDSGWDRFKDSVRESWMGARQATRR
jgi:uncharacterized protein (TIGR02271 family)